MRLLAPIPILAAALFALAQAPNADPAKVELKFDPKAAVRGRALKGIVKVTLPEGWHGYQNPPMREYEIPLKVTSPEKGVVLKVTYPKGKEIEAAGAKTWAYEGTVEVPFEILLPKKPGTFTFKLEVSYQLCNDQTCLPPDSVKTVGKIMVK